MKNKKYTIMSKCGTPGSTNQWTTHPQKSFPTSIFITKE